MMLSFARILTPSLVVLAASVASFQGLTFRPHHVSKSVKLTQHWPNTLGLNANPLDGGDNADSSTPTSGSEERQDVTALDKASFEIAKEYADKGIPGDSSSKGFRINRFSIILGAYLVFVVVDTIFHITPKENYSTVLGNAIRDAAGGGN